LYRVGDPLTFTGALEDCGDGFDWRVSDPSLRFWTDAALIFEAWQGAEWFPLEPLEVWRASGRVGFARCYRGESLRVSGVCRPLSLVVEAGGWEGEVHSTIHRKETLGIEPQVVAIPGDRICRFPALADGPRGRVLARLEAWEPDCLFVGCGDSISSTGSGTVLTFDEEGLVYVPC
jgi:hypothetical protein